MSAASLCNPATSSCVLTSSSNDTPLGDTLQLLNCERAVCENECGFPNVDADPPRPPPPPPPAQCGNGSLDLGEQCDLGTANGGAQCNPSCQVPTSGACGACSQLYCAQPYAGVFGLDADPNHAAKVTQLLECVANPEYASGGPIPRSSCFFANSGGNVLGDILPCYCGRTSLTTCLDLGPNDLSGACTSQMILASGCSAAVASCINPAFGNRATALGDVVALLSCQRAWCKTECGIPFDSGF